jgi:hypothetical protein
MASRSLILTTALATISLSQVSLAQSPPALPLLCKTDQSVGYKFDPASVSWKQTTFVPNTNYVVRDLQPGTTDAKLAAALKIEPYHPTVGVFDLAGNGIPEAYCRWANISGMTLVCDAQMSDFKLDQNLTKFIDSFEGGYLTTPTGTPPDTPAISIGHCAPFKD